MPLDRFRDSGHIISVFSERSVHGRGIECDINALDQWNWNLGAGARQGMSHPSILAKQDRLIPTLKVKTVGLPRTDSLK